MRDRNRVIINIDKLADNIESTIKILKNTSSHSRIYPVIKSDAYGIGADIITEDFLKQNHNSFVVFSLNEAVQLRQKFNKKIRNIYTLQGLTTGEEDIFYQNDIAPVLNSLEQVELWLNHAKKNNAVLPCTLQFETGMNRSGIALDDANEIASKINNNIYANSLNIDFIMSHLACADDPKNPHNKIQLDNFNRISKVFPKNIKKSLTASEGIKLGKEYIFDIVRPGIAFHKYENNSQIWGYYTTIHSIDKKQDTATINIGYLNGYYSKIARKGYIYINDIQYPLIKIEGDFSIIDISKNPNISLDDEVEIIGNNISINQLAEWMETIPYEVEISLLLNRDLDKHIIKDNTLIKVKNNNATPFNNSISKTGLLSHIAELRTIKNDGFIGYGASETVHEGDIIATIPLGYSNGIMRSIGNKNIPVYINDIQCEIIGRISMNHTTIKIPAGHVGDIKVSDKVYIISDKYPELSIKNWSEKSGLKIDEIKNIIKTLND